MAPHLDLPLPHVWLGVTAEDQQRADERIPLLLQTPAAHRWVSVEPMLGTVNICAVPDGKTRPAEFSPKYTPLGDLDWLVLGCESGAGRRPYPEDAARSVIEQCRAASVLVWHKQMPIGGKVSHDTTEWPEDLRVRQLPW